MNKEQIEKIQKLNAEIQSFRDCYGSIELWGERDGPVKVETLIAFLIENPHFQKIADNISKLSN
jgi:hypothetical protein